MAEKEINPPNHRYMFHNTPIITLWLVWRKLVRGDHLSKIYQSEYHAIKMKENYDRRYRKIYERNGKEYKSKVWIQKVEIKKEELHD